MNITFAHILAVLLLTGGAAACTKETAEPHDHLLPDEFAIKAKRNGANWMQPSSGTYSKSQKKFSIIGADYKSYGPEEMLRLAFTIPSEELPDHLLQSVQSLPAEWVDLLGGDILVDSYATADGAALPTIKITRLDTIQKVIEGRFEATLRRDKHFTQRTELMRFTNGSFRVRYQVSP